MSAGARPLLLDVLGTLVHDPAYDAMPAFFGTTLAELGRDLHPTAWVEFELGQLDEPAFFAKLFRDGRDYDHAGFKAAMRAGYAWLDGVEPLLDELVRAGAELHVLSNYPIWYRMIEERLGLSRYLRWSFVSCEMGVRKPDPEAFLLPARTLGVAPGACVLVDDRRRNVAAARALGMDAIRFEGAPALRAALAERGLHRDPPGDPA